jgi:hypothetical protein
MAQRSWCVETVADLPRDAAVLDYCWVRREGRTYRYDPDGWVAVKLVLGCVSGCTSERDLSDDLSSGPPGQVRRKPGGWYVAVRIQDPAAWVVIGVMEGKSEIVKIANIRAAQIYEWPVL